MAIGPFSMDAYLPAIPLMAEAFATSIVPLNYTMSAFLFGYAIGQFFGGPLSDQTGRKHIALFGLSVFILASIGIVSAGSVVQIQWLRILQGMGGGFAMVVCLPALRDVYSPREVAQKLPIVILITMLAPLVAPTLGSLMLGLGWRSIFVFLACYGLGLLLWYALGIPETHRGEKQRLSLAGIIPQYLSVATQQLEGRRIPLRYVLSVASSASVLMVLVTNAPFIYIQYFGASRTLFPALFGAHVIGLMLANFATSRLSQRFNPQRLFKLGGLLQLIGLIASLLVALTGFATLYTLVPLLVFSTATVGLINPSGSAMYMGYFQRLSGSAASLLAASIFATGAGLGVLTGLLFDGSLLPMLSIMLLGSALGSAIAHSIPPATLPNDPRHR